MAVWKYLNDYSVEQYVDERGKTKNRVTYVAGYYTLSPAIDAKNRLLIMVASLLLWLPFIAAFIPLTKASHIYYVTLPYVVSIIPLYLMTVSAVSLFREGEIFTREKSDKIVRNLPSCSIIVAILEAVAFVGLVVTAIIDAEGMLYGDIIFGAASLIIAVAGSMIFSKCRRIKAKKTDTAKS